MSSVFRQMKRKRRVSFSELPSSVQMTAFAIARIENSIRTDDILLWEVVARDEFYFVTGFMKAMKDGGHKHHDREMAIMLFQSFDELVRQKWGEDYPGKTAQEIARLLLEKVEIPSAPTQAEVDAGWEVESRSTEEGKRFFYGSDEHPEELIKKLIDEEPIAADGKRH